MSKKVVWLNKNRKLSLKDGTLVGYNESFDEKDVNPALLKKYKSEDFVGSKIVTDKDIKKSVAKEVDAVRAQCKIDTEKAIESVRAECDAQLAEMQSTIETAEADNAEVVKDLKKEIADLKKSVS